MNRISYWLAVTFLWIAGVCSLETFLQPLGVAPFLFEFVMAGTVIILLLPWCQTSTWFWMFCPLAVSFVLLKTRLGGAVTSSTLPMVVTELVAIGVTVALASRIARTVGVLRQDVSNAVLGHLDDRSQPFEAAQSEIYREVRRARLYDRPLALMTIACDGDSEHAPPAWLLEMIQKELSQKYLAGRLADLLSKEMRYSDIIAQRNGYFVALLPEASREEAAELITRIEVAADEGLGVKLRFGLAQFPSQEVTFDKLLERAETEMWSAQGAERTREIVGATR